MSALAAGGTAAEVTDADLRAVLDQNRRLEQQVQEQQRQIDALRQRLDQVAATRPGAETENAPGDRGGGATAEVRIAGEAGLAFFRTGSEGEFPNSEFRVDEARIYLGAPVWREAYFFGELQLTTREATDENVHLGELYLDLPHLAAAWGHDQLVNLRAGRLNIPFGEEYLNRHVMENPLISHSVSDIWGIDEGVELYGAIGPIRYAAAAQNGGNKALHDATSSKAVAGRLSLDPTSWLHLSASALRTGQLSATGDALSAVWFGGGFFRAIGAAATTTSFAAQLYEFDAGAHWHGGQVNAMVGQAHFNDNASTANDSRTLHYYSIEAVQQLIAGLQGAVRLSEVTAPGGYPLVGLGDFGEYFFRSLPATRLQRLSVGLDYRFGPPLIWKVEYGHESGRQADGESRNHEDLLATELGLRF